MSSCIPNQQLLLNTIINDVNLNYAELYRMMLLIGYGSSELELFFPTELCCSWHMITKWLLFPVYSLAIHSLATICSRVVRCNDCLVELLLIRIAVSLVWKIYSVNIHDIFTILTWLNRSGSNEFDGDNGGGKREQRNWIALSGWQKQKLLTSLLLLAKSLLYFFLSFFRWH